MPSLDEIDELIPLRLQIAEVEREISMRKNVYPRLVGAHKMRQSEGEEHIRRMRAVLATLKNLEEAGVR